MLTQHVAGGAAAAANVALASTGTSLDGGSLSTTDSSGSDVGTLSGSVESTSGIDDPGADESGTESSGNVVSGGSVEGIGSVVSAGGGSVLSGTVESGGVEASTAGTSEAKLAATMNVATVARRRKRLAGPNTAGILPASSTSPRAGDEASIAHRTPAPQTCTDIVRPMTVTSGDEQRDGTLPPAPSDIGEQLDVLHRHSEARTADLKEIAAQLPAVVGRRAMIRALVGDAAAGDKKEMMRRGWGRFRRLPRRVGNKVMNVVGRRPAPER